MKRTTSIPVGQRFGRLTVIGDGGIQHGHNRLFQCRCDCGTLKAVLPHSLRTQKIRSCGCLHRELLAARNYKHGQSTRRRRTPEHAVWAAMRQRCTNPLDRSYEGYGGRGIRVCERWGEYSAFYADMGPRPSRRHSIERLDNNGNYEPTNCKWATPEEQANNKRDTAWITYRGKQITMTEAAALSGFAYSTIQSRLRRGWSVERAIETPIRRR